MRSYDPEEGTISYLEGVKEDGIIEKSYNHEG